MPKFVPLQTKQTLSFMTFEGNTLQAIYSMMSERNHNTKKNIPMNLYNSTYRPFLTIFSVSTFSKCRKIGHKTNMVQRLNSLNTPYHTVLERGFWIIATNVKYDTNRLKMKAYVVLNKDGVSYVIHILIIFPLDFNKELP